MEVGIRLDMRAPAGLTPRSVLYREAHELAAYADRSGFTTLLVGEHHGADDGYTSAPFVVAASLGARTERLRLRLRAVLLPLRDPVLFAEELAMLDVVSQGRAEVVVGLGYVESEFRMFGLSPRSRVRRLEQALPVALRALAGLDVGGDGRSGRISPLPVQQSVPFYLGGGVPAAARRAARFGVGFAPHLDDPELIEEYVRECARLERATGPVILNPGHYALFVADDPEQFWHRLEPHARHNADAYFRMASGSTTVSPFSANGGDDLEGLKARAQTWVVSPEECIHLARETAARGRSLQFVPLLGGLSPEVAWESLQLFVERVLPEIADLVEPGTAAAAQLSDAMDLESTR